MYLLPGIAGFAFFILFDLNKIYWKFRILNLSFILGSVLLAFSTVYSVLQSDFSVLMEHFGIWQFFKLICLILSGAALIYTLFFALPFDSTYVQSSDLPLVNKGVYGACRHPGFWMLALFYLFLALFFSNIQLIYCFLIYNICNFLYIVLQDVFIFPQYINGYNEYKKAVPFLVPTGTSIRNAFFDKNTKNRR